jgi:hypothetical protein
MKIPTRLLILLVVSALLLSACAVASRNALLGKWDNTTQDLTIEFTMDGHMRQTSQGVTQELGFQFVNDHTITLQTPTTGAAPQPIPFTISGDKLSLDLGLDQSGQTQKIEFLRAK